jgi:dihydropyrimidinase
VTFDTVIKTGTVVTSGALFEGDVGIQGEKVVALGQGLDGTREIDAGGMLVVPGAIDVHTHFETRIGEGATADDYESGSRAAAAGGITTFVNFVFSEPGQGLVEAVRRERVRAAAGSHLDYSFHVVVTDAGRLGELPELAAQGLTSLKLFTALGDMELSRRDILRVLSAARSSGMVVAVHAEDGPLIDHLTEGLLSGGRTGVEWLPAARPAEAEALAVTYVCAYAAATGCPVYIVHLSSGLALEAVRRARASGARVYVETRPAYLYLEEGRYQLGSGEGNKFVCWPPLRSAADQAALWEGLASGEIQTYATDHTTWTKAEKMAPGLTFDQIPGGISNVQTSLGMLYSEGFGRGRISLQRLVEVSSTNPARLFGLWPRKGTIAVGSDADLVLIDPTRRYRIVEEEMESRSDFDPYSGLECLGWPVVTMSRGQVIMEHGHVTSSPGRGHFLPRPPFTPL